MSAQRITGLVLAGVAVGVLAAAARGAIITAGNVTSPYSGPGPWTIPSTYSVGNTGVGSVAVDGNSAVTSNGYLLVGNAVGGNGTITLNDGDWTSNDRTYVGNYGTGKMEVLSSSRWRTNHFAYAGQYGGAVGTVDLNGGRWDMYWNGFIGWYGDGEVIVRNGGYWYNDYGTRVYLGYAAGGNGVVNMSGGTWLVRGDVYIGNGGAGTVNLTGGTMRVEPAGGLIFGSQGKFILDGGTLDLQNYNQLPGPDKFEFRSGTLSMRYRGPRWANAVFNDACTLSLYSSGFSVDTLTATAGSTVTLGEGSSLSVGSNGFASFQNAVSLDPTSQIWLSGGAQLSHTVHTLELNGATVSGQGPGVQVVVGEAGVNLGTIAAPGRIEGEAIWELLNPEAEDWEWEWVLLGYEPLALYGDVFGCGTLVGVTVYGNVHVGNEPGGLTLEYADLGCATVGMEVGGPLAGPDGLVVCGAGTTFASASVSVAFAGGYEPERGDGFQLFSAADGEDLAAMLAGWSLSLPEDCSLDTSSGIMVYVPEPATLGFVALGMAGMFLRRRR